MNRSMHPPSPVFEKRLSSQSGIAIGIILFVLVLIGVISVAVSASGNFMGTTVTPDRINVEIKSQANLIRTKITECIQNATMRLDANFTNPGGGGYTSPFPLSTGTGTAIEAVDCPSYGSGVQNLWKGQAPLQLPPAPQGFDKWYYVNAGDMGGRCIRIQPTAANVADPGVKQGIGNAASTFTDMERVYDPAGASQRLIIWITKPTGTTSADCST